MPKKNDINWKIKLVASMNGVIGSWLFLIMHLIIFILWLSLKASIELLTMIVSLVGYYPDDSFINGSK